MGDRPLFLPTLGERNFDFADTLCGQSLLQQLAFRNLVRQQDQRRTWLVVVELRQECPQHLAGSERAVGLGKIGAVAPVLAGAEEENLNAAKSALLMDREHIGLLRAARI